MLDTVLVMGLLKLKKDNIAFKELLLYWLQIGFVCVYREQWAPSLVSHFQKFKHKPQKTER